MISCVLAAGSAQRFGSCKALYEIDQKPMIQHVLDALPTNHDVYVVTGSYKKELENYLDSKHVKSIFNPDHEQGMGTSIRVAATKAIELNSDLLLTFCDLPYVSKDDYKKLVELLSTKPVFSKFEEVIGPPAVFPKNQIKALMALDSDRGAKGLFKEYDVFPLPNAAKDIDQPLI